MEPESTPWLFLTGLCTLSWLAHLDHGGSHDEGQGLGRRGSAGTRRALAGGDGPGSVQKHRW